MFSFYDAVLLLALFLSGSNLSDSPVVLSSIQLEMKSDSELFELMTHREEIMRSRALLIIFNKIRGAGVSKAQQQVCTVVGCLC